MYIGKTECHLCPVTAAMQYMSLRGPVAGPFFKFKNDNPLTKSAFTSRIRAALQALGFPEDNFTGHSFRIGVPSTAASVDIEDYGIRSMGRWKSSAFLLYIQGGVHTPRECLGTFPRT